jgi:urate oxidase
MAIVLGPNQYGKAENRLVRIHRDSARHEIRDLNVSTSLQGGFAAAYLDGDQSSVLPTDSQKQTVYAYAKEKGIGQIEDFALALARHFVDDVEPVESARVEIEECAWERITVGPDSAEHDHSWVRRGREVRTAVVTVDRGDQSGRREHVIAGLRDLVLLKSTGSEFHGFLEDPYTVLEPTRARVMATSLVARWRHVGVDHDWGASYASILQTLVEQFATVHSLALQQTLYEMGRAVLEAHDDVAEIRFSAPNKHHFVYDLSPFGLDNPNEVFHADDRPYGLIEATVLRDDAPPAGRAWDGVPGFC